MIGSHIDEVSTAGAKMSFTSYQVESVTDFMSNYANHLAQELRPILLRSNPNGNVRPGTLFNTNLNMILTYVSMSPNGSADEESIDLCISVHLLPVDNEEIGPQLFPRENLAKLEVEFVWSDGEMISTVLESGFGYETLADVVTRVDALLVAREADLVW
jgi:hypothetical protein